MRRASLGSILTIAGHEYVVNVRRPGFIFFTLLIPALGALTLVVAGFFSGQAASFFASQFGGQGRSAAAELLIPENVENAPTDLMGLDPVRDPAVL